MSSTHCPSDCCFEEKKKDCLTRRIKVHSKAYVDIKCVKSRTHVMKCGERCLKLCDDSSAVFICGEGCFKVWLPCDPCGEIHFSLPCEADVKLYYGDCCLGKLCGQGQHMAVKDCDCWYFR